MLKLSEVTVLFQDRPIIKNVSFSLEPGTVHALMGPNGSGKSTLALALMGYPQYTILSGSVLFNGKDLRAMSTEQRAREGLFLVCQQPPAVPGVPVLTFLKEAHRMLTGKDISLSDFKDEVYRAFDEVHLDHSFVYRTVHEGFSGGEKKRFEIAQLLLFKPKLAILDELDSGLDVDALRNLAQVVASAREKQGLTVLIITHYKRMLEYIKPDYVHVLSQGSLWGTSDYTLADTIDTQGYDGLLI